MERFQKLVNGFKPLTIFSKRSILDAWQGSEYAYGMLLDKISDSCIDLELVNPLSVSGAFIYRNKSIDLHDWFLYEGNTGT